MKNKNIELLIDSKIRVVLEQDEDGYLAYCPAIKGLHAGGKTQDETIRNFLDAFILYLKNLEPFPFRVVHPQKSSKKILHRHVNNTQLVFAGC
jgi:predicted RNase H-like HicB family nuclease